MLYSKINGKLKTKPGTLYMRTSPVPGFIRNKLLALYGGRMNSDGTRFLDSTGNYEVGKGVSLAFDGTGYGKLVDDAGNDASVVVSAGADFVIKLNIYTPAFGSTMALLAADSDNRIQILSDGRVYVEINNITFITTATLTAGGRHEIVIQRVSSTITVSWGSAQESGPTSNSEFPIVHMGILSRTIYPLTCEAHSLYIATLDAEGNETPIFVNSLAQTSDTGYLVSQVGPHVQLVNLTVPDCFTESVLFGHTWGADGKGFSEYDGTEGVAIGGTAVVGKIPASLETPGLDVFGNPLTHTGKPQYNFKALGYTGQWDGVAYAIISKPVTLSGNFRIKFRDVRFDASVNNSTRICAGGTWNNDDVLNNYCALKLRTDGSLGFEVRQSGTSEVNSGAISPVGGDLATVDWFAFGRGDTGYYLETEDGISTGPTGSIDFLLKWLIGEATPKVSGRLGSIAVYDATDTLIHHWIVESRKDSEQPITYDIVGGNHATLVNATLGEGGFWSAQKEGSLLAEGGFTEGEPDGVELVTGDNYTLDSIGNWYAEDASIVVSGNVLTVTATGATQKSRLDISGLVIGDTYRVKALVRSDNSTTPVSVGFAPATYSGGSVSLSTEWQELVFDVVAAATTHPFGMYTNAPNGESYQIAAGFSIQHIPKGQIPRRTHEWVPDGVELFSDSELDNSDSWTKGVGWSVSSGVAVHSAGSTSGLTEAVGIIGETYRITYKVNSISGGWIKALCGNGTGGTERLSAGTYTEDLVCSGNTAIGLYAESGTTCEVEFVSVQKVNLQPTTKQLSCLGQPLTHKAGQLQNAPCDIEAVPSVAGYLADATEQVSGVPIVHDMLVGALTPNGNIVIHSSTSFTTTGVSGVFWEHVVVGKEYELEITKLDATVECGVHNDVSSENFILGSVGRVRFVAVNNRLYVRNYSAGNTTIEFTVREILDPTNLLYEPDGDTIQRPATDLVLDLGEELWVNPAPQTIDANNYSTFDPDTGIGRVVSDGTYVALSRTSSLVAGKAYVAVVEILSKTGGEIKLIDGVTVMQTPLETAVYQVVSGGTNLGVSRVTGACDVSFKLSVREILGTQSNLNNQVLIGSKGMLIYKEPQTVKAAGNAAIAIGA